MNEVSTKNKRDGTEMNDVQYCLKTERKRTKELEDSRRLTVLF